MTVASTLQALGVYRPETNMAASTKMKGGHTPIMTFRRRPAKEGQHKGLRDLARIAPGAAALIVCITALVAALQTVGNGRWLYFAITVSCLTFGVAFLTRVAISGARETPGEEEVDPDRAEAEWLPPFLML